MVHSHHYNTRKPPLSPLSVIINPTFRSSLEFYRIKRAPFTVSGIGNTRFFSILIGHTFSNKTKFFTKYLTVPPGRSTARSPLISDRSPFQFREEAGDRSHDPPKKSEFICYSRDSFHRGLQHTGIAVIDLLGADHVHELIGDIDIRLFQRSRHDVARVRCTGPTRCRITT